MTADTLIPHVRGLVHKEFEKQNYPGLVVAVWQQGQMKWSEGFGFADIENGVKADPAQSLFRIGSISKTLTTVGLAKLTEHGSCDLDAPVQKYVPYFPEKRWPITTKQVAQHVAGIRHYRGQEFLSNVHYNTVHDALGVFKDDTLLFKPGEQYSYSSYGWNLISAVVEGASGRPFLNYIQEEVFDPAGMHHSFPDDVFMRDLPRVAFYDDINGENVLCPQVDNSLKWAGGGFISTAEDLVRFGIAILDHTLINDETTQLFWTPATLSNGNKTNYGIGWATSTDKRGRTWVGHAGGSVGGTSMFLMYPDAELIVVVLVNRTQGRAQELAFTVADQFLGN